MSSDPRVRVFAALLAQGRVLFGALAVSTLAVWSFGGPWSVGLGALVFTVGTYLAVRVGLDAELFAALAEGASRDEIDRGLVDLGLVAHAPKRSVDVRIAGARRLWRQLLACVVAQGVLAAVAWWWP